MEKRTINKDSERFLNGADKYAAYLESPEGRLRLDLAFANLQDFLPTTTSSLLALDVGCGTGAIALRLAKTGMHVTLLDISNPMLAQAERAAQKAGLKERIALMQGDASRLSNLFGPKSFDTILCHNVLEFVEDPASVLSNAARLLCESAGIISVLVRNRSGEVLKAAIKDGDLTQSENDLTAEWGHEALYGGRVRLFSADSLQNMLAAASLTIFAVRGVRVVADYLPANISRNVEYERIFQLERKLGLQPEFAAIARYTQCLAHPTAFMKDDA